MPSSPVITKRSSTRTWVALSAVAILALAAYVWWQHQQSPGDAALGAPAGAQAGGTRSAWPSATGMPAGGEGAAGPFILKGPVGDSRPPDFSQQDWDALNKALANEPNKDKERNRLVSYLRFQRGVSKWSEMKDSPNVAERQGLARELAEQLPVHVGAGEVNSGEAAMLLTAIASDVEPDPAKRQAWVEAQRGQMQSQQSPEQARALEEEKRKNDAFAAEQSEIVKRWQSTPPEGRDPATLERQLQALREKVYGARP